MTAIGFHPTSAKSLNKVFIPNSAIAVTNLAELPPQTIRKLPRYPVIPAPPLERRAVDRRQ
jgi:hypothetical protein